MLAPRGQNLEAPVLHFHYLKMARGCCQKGSLVKPETTSTLHPGGQSPCVVSGAQTSPPQPTLGPGGSSLVRCFSGVPKRGVYCHSLEEVRTALQEKETDCLRMTEEVERTRTLESKAFQEKEQLRSKLEELYEEKERTSQVPLCVYLFLSLGCVD